MRKTFREYYPPSDKQFETLWNDCFFALDANVLLNMHRYGPDTRVDFLRVLERLKDRLWVPHQAALEYQKNRPDVVAQQNKPFGDIADALDKANNTLLDTIRRTRLHPVIQKDKLEQTIVSAIQQCKDDIQEWKRQHEVDFENDPYGDQVQDTLTNLLDGKIGDEYGAVDLDNLYKLGKQRYARRQPPGFMDKPPEKAEPDCYGDFIIWQQIIDQAKLRRQPVILVTDDKKKDWWWEQSGRTIGPRPELVKEIQVVAGVMFYMYRSDQFLKWATKITAEPIKDETLNEVTSVSKTPFIDSMVAQDDMIRGITRDDLLEVRALRNMLRHYDIADSGFQPITAKEAVEIARKLIAYQRTFSNSEQWRRELPLFQHINDTKDDFADEDGEE